MQKCQEEVNPLQRPPDTVPRRKRNPGSRRNRTCSPGGRALSART
nr:MAG TPA: hypothetical protein [Caudoviricetes sp.]